MKNNKHYLVWKLLLLAISAIFIVRGLIKKPKIEPQPEPAIEEVVTNAPPVVVPAPELPDPALEDLPPEPKPEPEPEPEPIPEPEPEPEPIPEPEPEPEPEMEMEEEPSVLDELFPGPDTNETEIIIEEPIETNIVEEVEEPKTNVVEIVEEIFEEEPPPTNLPPVAVDAAIPIIIERATTRGRIVLLEDSDSDRYVVKDVPIAIWHIDEDGKETLLYQTRTDEDGMFSLPELKEGIYRSVMGRTPMLMQVVPPVTKLREQERAAPKALLVLMPKHAI